MITSFALLASLTVAAPAATRVAVVLDDPAPSQPARAALESALQNLGYEVVSKETVEAMRPGLAPKSLLESRLPEGLSVFEADAILAGAAAYGEPNDVDGVKSAQISLTARLIDLATGRTTSTLQTAGVGVGVPGPALLARGAKQASDRLFKHEAMKKGLENLGQETGLVTLVVQGIPTREALLELKTGLENTFGGAPVEEVYFAKGLGKLAIGGSKAKSMTGPQMADDIGKNKSLALVVEEVANTRIVASYNRAKAVQIHALVLEPKVTKKVKASADELGRYVATRFATFDYARASYQPGQLSRKQAMGRAGRLHADVLVESEIMGSGPSAALTIRILDAKTGKPILRHQTVISEPSEQFNVIESMLSEIQTSLPDLLATQATETARPAEVRTPAVAAGDRVD